MRFIILALLIFSTPAQAGICKGFWAKHIIDADPYQYEGASSAYLAELYKIEGAKTYWIHGKSRVLGILGAQLRANAITESMPEETIRMLENYKEFEL